MCSAPKPRLFEGVNIPSYWGRPCSFRNGLFVYRCKRKNRTWEKVVCAFCPGLDKDARAQRVATHSHFRKCTICKNEVYVPSVYNATVRRILQEHRTGATCRPKLRLTKPTVSNKRPRFTGPGTSLRARAIQNLALETKVPRKVKPWPSCPDGTLFHPQTHHPSLLGCNPNSQSHCVSYGQFGEIRADNFKPGIHNPAVLWPVVMSMKEFKVICKRTTYTEANALWTFHAQTSEAMLAADRFETDNKVEQITMPSSPRTTPPIAKHNPKQRKRILTRPGLGPRATHVTLFQTTLANQRPTTRRHVCKRVNRHGQKQR